MNSILSITLILLVGLFANPSRGKVYKLKLSKDLRLKTAIPFPHTEGIIVKGADFTIQSSSFTIGISDNNRNKKFNDIGKDRIWLEFHGTIVIRFQDGVSNALIATETYFKVDNFVFKIISIDEDGKFIKIQVIKDFDLVPNLKLVNRIPDYDFKLLDGNNTNFNDYINKEKYIYVEFWGSWCKPCLDIIPRIKEIHNSYKDNMTIISINNSDSPKWISEFVTSQGIEWIQGKVSASSSLPEEFLLNGYPYGVLFKPNGEVIKFHMKVYELNEFCTEHFKQ